MFSLRLSELPVKRRWIGRSEMMDGRVISAPSRRRGQDDVTWEQHMSPIDMVTDAIEHRGHCALLRRSVQASGEEQ